MPMAQSLHLRESTTKFHPPPPTPYKNSCLQVFWLTSWLTAQAKAWGPHSKHLFLRQQWLHSCHNTIQLCTNQQCISLNTRSTLLMISYQPQSPTVVTTCVPTPQFTPKQRTAKQNKTEKEQFLNGRPDSKLARSSQPPPPPSLPQGHLQMTQGKQGQDLQDLASVWNLDRSVCTINHLALIHNPKSQCQVHFSSKCK